MAPVEAAPVRWRAEWPMRMPSVANLREHWASRARRAKLHRSAAMAFARAACLAQTGQQPPVWLAAVGAAEVTLTRQAPRKLDDDNLAAALKAVRDGVADALGIDDRDERVTWRYAQQRGAAAIVVTVDASRGLAS